MEISSKPMDSGAACGYAGTSREELLKMIRDTVEEKGRRIGLYHFLTARSLRRKDVFRNFSTWGEALQAAGCKTPAHNKRLESAQMLEDWGAVARKVKRVPTATDYNLHGTHAQKTLCQRFGAWRNIPDVFRAFAARRPEWKGVLKHIACSTEKKDRRRAEMAAHKRMQIMMMPRRRVQRLRHRPLCGAQLDHGTPLRYAPTNEQGVVLLFGKMAERLGFFVVGLQSAFPDCLAMREITPGNWQPVTIEFEFLSRAFQLHRHKPDGCDIIVCWEHNWKECPKNLEVIALRDEMEREG